MLCCSSPHNVTISSNGLVWVASENGKKRTLRSSGWPQRPELACADQGVLTPQVITGQVDVAPSWLTTITLAGRRQLTWPVRACAGRSGRRGTVSFSTMNRRRAACPARRSRTTKCISTNNIATRSRRLLQRPAPASVSVHADLNLTHPADPILTRGWAPTT